MVVRIQLNAKDNSNVDLDVLQAAINLSHRDKFLRDRASRRVAMKRLYQRHPVGTLCQEGVRECSEVLGGTFILILILYRICSKQSRAQAARIKISNRAAVVLAVRVKADRADHTKVKSGTVTDRKSSNRKAECNVVTAKAVVCTSKDRTVDPPNHEVSCSTNFMPSTNPTLAVDVFDVRGHVRYLRAVIRQRLLMSGDVELNPGPLDEIERILSSVDDTTFCEDDWNIVIRECSSLAAKWQQLGGYLGLPIGLIDSIKGNYPNDNSACWSEALKQWIQQNYNTARFGLPSWRTLLEAIARENRLLFKTLADNHQASAASGLSASEESMKMMTTSQQKMDTDDKEASPAKVQKKKRKRKRKPKMIMLGPEAGQTEDAHIQQIIVPAHDTVSAESVNKLPTLTFQCVSLECMNKEEKKQFYQRLYSESVEMMFKFQRLFSSTTISLNKRKVPSQDICSRVQCLGSLTPVFEDSGLPVFRQQIPKLQQARTADDAMSVINGYCSFFNFHILELIIEQLGSSEDVANLSDYKKDFSEYAKRHVFQCPSEIGTMTFGDAKMFVTLDETFNKCSLSTLYLFCSNLCQILNLSPGSGLKLCQIEPGSLKLTFQLPFSLLQDVFPLTEEQESAIARLGVEKLWLIYTFNKQHVQVEDEEEIDAEATDLDSDKTDETDEETADSASDRSEETDKETADSNTEERVAGIELVSMVTGLSIGKPDDASSIADSAIATSIFTFTGVSQYSEDIVERDLRDEPYLRMEHDAAKLRPPDDSSGLELHQASLRGELNKVKQLVENQNLNPLQKNEHGDTALHLAAVGGSLSIMKYFTEEQGLSPACQGYNGWTPLHRAAYDNHLELVKYLVAEQQVDPLCKTETGYTSLHTACQGGDMDVIRFLINEIQKYMSLQDIIYEKTKHETIPLHLAAAYGHLPVVKFFISELKCDPNTPGWQGRSPLHYAAQGGSLDTIQYLIEQMNCNASQLDEQQVTPLHLAAMHGHLHIVKYLIQDKLCNPLCRHKAHNTPLHDAAREGHLEVVQYYIQTIQCSPNIRGWRNMTPLELARSNGHSHVVNYLESLSTK